jgi:hypothetical protein
MTDTLGQVVLSRFEDLKISLIKIGGEPHVELRIYARAASGNAGVLPGGRAIVLPVSLLPELLRAMTVAKEVCIERELIFLPKTQGTETWQSGTASVAGLRARTDSRRSPRAHVRIPVECRLLDPTTFWPGKWVAGEITNLSVGGAQMWLDERFPRFRQVEVIGEVEETVLRGRGEIVGADLIRTAPKNGRHRHSLRWVSMDTFAQSALSRLVPMTIGST